MLILFSVILLSACATRKKATVSEVIDTAIDEALNAPNKAKKDKEHPAKKGWPPKF